MQKMFDLKSLKPKFSGGQSMPIHHLTEMQNIRPNYSLMTDWLMAHTLRI
jgi:hypothetical protein